LIGTRPNDPLVWVPFVHITPFVQRPAGVSSALGGAEQMALLNDKWVRIQDVQASRELGRIALSDDRTLGMHTLDRDRLYE